MVAVIIIDIFLTCPLPGYNLEMRTSMRVKQLRQLNNIALLNKSSQSYKASLAIWDHTVLPATRHE